MEYWLAYGGRELIGDLGLEEGRTNMRRGGGSGRRFHWCVFCAYVALHVLTLPSSSGLNLAAVKFHGYSVNQGTFILSSLELILTPCPARLYK